MTASLARPLSQSETVLSNAQIVLPGETVLGSVVVREGLIAAIDTGASRSGDIDCAGDYLCPGLIELHTDNLERHLQPRPGVDWPPQAACIAHDAELASVGITTVFDALRVGSLLSGGRSRYGKYARGLCDAILTLRTQGAFRISHFIHLRAEICSETLAEELDEFGPEDRIGILSLMDHTPGQRQFVDPSQHRQYLRGKHGLAEEDIDAHYAHLHDIKARFGTLHEQKAVADARRLGAILASHDDTEVAHVETSLAHGAALAEFPTTEPAARASHEAGIAVMMGAPNYLRGGSHSGNVAAKTLAEAGLLDILSSDYAPSSLLMAAVRLGQDQGSIAKGLATVTEAPARAASLTDRGRLEVGLRADLVRFRLAGETPALRGLWVKGARVG
ncbi:MAG: alpha-D-ribose 1-methylphosphonate 5-triphosphate diphosphatase [Pseudomonadota bacterium]